MLLSFALSHICICRSLPKDTGYDEPHYDTQAAVQHTILSLATALSATNQSIAYRPLTLRIERCSMKDSTFCDILTIEKLE
jgi:hypothetical protein